MLDGGHVFYARPRTGVYGNLDTSLHQRELFIYCLSTINRFLLELLSGSPFLLGHAKWYYGFWFGPFPTQQAGGRFYSLCHYSSFQFKSDITTKINNNQVKQHANMLARLNNRSGPVPCQFRPLDKQYRTLRRSCKRERQAEVLDT